MTKTNKSSWWHQHASRQTSEPVDAKFMDEQRAVTERERAREQAEREAAAAKRGMTLAEYEQALDDLFRGAQ